MPTSCSRASTRTTASAPRNSPRRLAKRSACQWIRKPGAARFLLVGDEEWPFPIPIVKRGATWSFDPKSGRRELLYRRVGANELDAIAICRGYVEAQHEYALQKREGYEVNQYAQRIISTPGKQDGLAWQTADGKWDGPIGEAIARAIEQGYSNRAEPYHGYFFKILKGQGPAAPLGQMDFVVKGAMIGGFALVAAPAEVRRHRRANLRGQPRRRGLSEGFRSGHAGRIQTDGAFQSGPVVDPGAARLMSISALQTRLSNV